MLLLAFQFMKRTPMKLKSIRLLIQALKKMRNEKVFLPFESNERGHQNFPLLGDTELFVWNDRHHRFQSRQQRGAGMISRVHDVNSKASATFAQLMVRNSQCFIFRTAAIQLKLIHDNEMITVVEPAEHRPAAPVHFPWVPQNIVGDIFCKYKYNK